MQSAAIRRIPEPFTRANTYEIAQSSCTRTLIPAENSPAKMTWIHFQQLGESCGRQLQRKVAKSVCVCVDENTSVAHTAAKHSLVKKILVHLSATWWVLWEGVIKKGRNKCRTRSVGLSESLDKFRHPVNRVVELHRNAHTGEEFAREEDAVVSLSVLVEFAKPIVSLLLLGKMDGVWVAAWSTEHSKVNVNKTMSDVLTAHLKVARDSLANQMLL